MIESLQKVNSNNKLQLWITKVQECRNSGLSRAEWCHQNNIPPTTYSYWQKKVYEYYRNLQNQESTFVEVPAVNEVRTSLVVKQGDIVIELNDASAIREVIRALKSC